ncbi:serine acetyltransferase [Caenibius tardaugens NBRC 16725]|uniref:serine O-acetyltransferase n=1 Tax=Caenibius tardaugens NBRC 16725 TaxID=1219035 RepID=U2ZTB0_9SPHN|nr:serine O-acetyltransferase EpsC [Caenibius tardaugens]AZI36268.1 serine acetyltransferase [Caenibius tardaugens NBRC 16725]GAD48619.1 serine acetyltransferase [Caenibius tardaugens NBRC 16725]
MTSAESQDGEQESFTDFWEVDHVVNRLSDIRRSWRAANTSQFEYGVEGFPSRTKLAKVTEELSAVLFPLRLGPGHVRPHNEDEFVTKTLQIALSRLHSQLRLELTYALPGVTPDEIATQASAIVAKLSRALPQIRILLDTDIEAAFRGDPAARSVDEVLICYPSILAIIHYRLAHQLHQLGAPLVARIIAEIAHGRTGIDIHPGATIGEGFFIDHGTGVVIGETAIIGNNVRIYQGVTLGAKSFPTDQDGALVKAMPRHPVVEDNVVIYAGATILGRVTIGQGSEIGGNVWLAHDVPPNSRVLQAREQNQVLTPGLDVVVPLSAS